MPAPPPALETVLVEARELGLLGPGPIGPHLDHARGFAAAFDQVSNSGPGSPGTRPSELASPEKPSVRAIPDHVLDLGSGGGLPGLVLATVWPHARFSLLDVGERRVTFLREAIEACGLADRVRVLHGRAEEIGRRSEERGTYDLVVARSFGPPAVTAECAAPFLRVGGLLITSEPPAERTADGRWSEKGLALLGLTSLQQMTQPFAYRIAMQSAPCSDRYPRRVGVSGKRPLF